MWNVCCGHPSWRGRTWIHHLIEILVGGLLVRNEFPLSFLLRLYSSLEDKKHSPTNPRSKSQLHSCLRWMERERERECRQWKKEVSNSEFISFYLTLLLSQAPALCFAPPAIKANLGKMLHHHTTTYDDTTKRSTFFQEGNYFNNILLN